MRINIKAITLALGLAACASASADEITCPATGISLQLLGSGGPITDDARASSGMVVWMDGKSRMLIDAGGGTYLRFGQAGARLEDLRFIGISHFHTDHVADLPAILKGAYFLRSRSSLALSGPTGNANFPGMTEFFQNMFGDHRGAFEYLSGLHDATDGLMLAVHPQDVNVKSKVKTLVYEDGNVHIYALGIPHGDVPCLAYRIETPNGVIVVSADQNGSRREFVDFAKDADVLVMPAAIDEDADDSSKYLHAPPSVVGQVAAEANAKMLVLDHFMGRSLKDRDKNVAIIKRYYHGPVFAGKDLSCFTLNAN